MSKFPKQNSTTIEKKARSVDEAIAEALEELGAAREDVSIEIVQEPSKGFLGLGAKEAIVKVSLLSNDSSETYEEEPVETEPAVSEEVPKAAVAEEKQEEVKLVYCDESPAENARKFISDILNAMGLDVKVTAVLEDDIVKINLDGENMGIVIGKRGDTLDSLQYLTSLVVNRASEDYIKISIDTENYREKRSEALEALAERLAAKVARTGKKFTLRAYEPV